MSLPSRERGLKPSVSAIMTSSAASLPSRERGLKPGSDCMRTLNNTSLPSRERGLKPMFLHRIAKLPESLPSRERGLKLFQSKTLAPQCQVAPLTGAWIETSFIKSRSNLIGRPLA